MRDTTEWRKDADRLRQGLLDAYRAGNRDSIAKATQALIALLQRPDRPSPPVRKTTAERRLAAIRAWQRRCATLADSKG